MIGVKAITDSLATTHNDAMTKVLTRVQPPAVMQGSQNMGRALGGGGGAGAGARAGAGAGADTGAVAFAALMAGGGSVRDKLQCTGQGVVKS